MLIIHLTLSSHGFLSWRDGHERDEKFSAAFCCFPHWNMNERVFEFFFLLFSWENTFYIATMVGKMIKCMAMFGIWIRWEFDTKKKENGNFDVSWSKLLPYILIISMNCHWVETGRFFIVLNTKSDVFISNLPADTWNVHETKDAFYFLVTQGWRYIKHSRNVYLNTI